MIRRLGHRRVGRTELRALQLRDGNIPANAMQALRVRYGIRLLCGCPPVVPISFVAIGTFGGWSVDAAA